MMAYKIALNGGRIIFYQGLSLLVKLSPSNRLAHYFFYFLHNKAKFFYGIIQCKCSHSKV